MKHANKQPMLILTIDTTDTACRFGLSYAERNIMSHVRESAVRHISHSRQLPHKQAEQILPMIKDGLAESPYDKTDITAIATATGPGSFSGIRIGLATAHGLGLALNIPVLGYDNFYLWNKTLREKYTLAKNAVLLIVLQSKRQDLYVTALPTSANRPLLLSHQSAYPETIIAFIKSCKNKIYLAGNMNDEFLSLVPPSVAAQLTPLACHDFDTRLLGLQAVQDITNKKYPQADPHYVTPPQTSKAKKIWTPPHAS